MRYKEVIFANQSDFKFNWEGVLQTIRTVFEASGLPLSESHKYLFCVVRMAMVAIRHYCISSYQCVWVQNH